MITDWKIDDYLKKALEFQAKGDRYSFLEYLVETEMKLLKKESKGVAKKSQLEESIKRLNKLLPLKRRMEEGTGSTYDQNKHQIKKPRTISLKGRQRIENPPSSMEVQDEFRKAVDEKKMGFLVNELRKIEEAERRRREEEVLVAAEILISLKKETPFLVVCDDQKQERTEMLPCSSSSHPNPQQKKRKRNGFVRRDQLLLRMQSTSPPEMPVKIQEAIKLLRGTPPVWLTEKILEDSDVKDDQGRLFIPTCEALEQFMTDEEKNTAWVEKKKKQKKKEIGLNVILVNPMGDQSEISFRKWGSLSKCVFTRTWKGLCQRFNLLPTKLRPSNEKHSRDMVQLWCFRLPVERDSKLCFAINIIKNVQLGDEELDAVDQSREMAISNCIEPSFDHFEARPDQSREMAISNCIEPSFDHFEARPLKKHCSKVEF